MQQKLAKDKESISKQAEELKRSIEVKKQMMCSGEVKLNSSGGNLRASQTNPMVEVARNTNRTKGEDADEYEYYSEDEEWPYPSIYISKGIRSKL